MELPNRESFRKVFEEAERNAQVEAENAAFPAYLDSIDTVLAPFCPTSVERVLKALTLAKVGPNDRLLDLGSGDGRFVTAAVSEYNAQYALGIESDEALVERARSLADRVMLTDRIRFQCDDLLSMLHAVQKSAEWPWTVLVLFLLPDRIEELAPLLEEHQRLGGRIVSLVFNLSEIKALQLITSDEGSHIYVYGQVSNAS